MGKNGIPSRWLDYQSIGQEIRGVPIIACKVPLKEDLVRYKIKRDQWFTPEMLVEKVPNVGCIVDLTATDRYYNPSVFTQRGIHHAKIFCEGHVIPKPTTVQRFFQVLDDFFHSVHSRGKVLMVHCTHGLNRTGYLVSRYMVERRGIHPEAAIHAFNRARGHYIERANYLQDLRKMNSRVCRNPVPLFQKGAPRRVHQEPTAASHDTTSSNDHHLDDQDGRSGTHDHSPPFPDYHQPPPVAQTYNERPSFVTQPIERHPTGPSHGQQQLNWRQGPSSGPRSHYADLVNSQGRNNSPLPPTDSYSAGHQRPAQHPYAPAPVVPCSVPVHDYSQPPPPIINKLPNLKWIVTDSFPVQLNNNLGDRPKSANRSRSDDHHHQSASRSQSRGASPVDAGRRKPRRNRSSPPAASSSSEQRRENRHRDDRRQDSKVHSHSVRSSHRDHPFDRPVNSSSSSRQDFSSDQGAPGKRERSRRRRDAGRSAERS
ncbi:RNA/RNP complex-1-interacting phosphatase-like isoform X1 [Daphnia pulicaria]|uniref:RNA/RNP complex-1-interacting phosphatase-like isoform X1 n=1 Tax=Daphnia pulicaria TaxID=35523 RepID=UPI001EEAE51C|nr:RNA/RNP complex-1-interacting phosphatase-like isoform X1 [Daphnia pulicaria]